MHLLVRGDINAPQYRTACTAHAIYNATVDPYENFYAVQHATFTILISQSPSTSRD